MSQLHLLTTEAEITFPNEIYQVIFQFLPLNCLKCCRLVSRYFQKYNKYRIVYSNDVFSGNGKFWLKVMNS